MGIAGANHVAFTDIMSKKTALQKRARWSSLQPLTEIPSRNDKADSIVCHTYISVCLVLILLSQILQLSSCAFANCPR